MIFELHLAFKVIGVVEVSGNRLPSGFAPIKVGKGAVSGRAGGETDLRGSGQVTLPRALDAH